MSAFNAVIAGGAYVKIMADNSGLEKGLNQAQSKLKRFASGISRFSNKMLKLAPLGIVAGQMLKTFQEFDDRMRMVKAITGATAQQFDNLTEKAKKLGRETRFTASQVSEGMISLGRMGFSPKEIDDSIKPVMNLSTATGTELATSSEIAANNMRVFGMQANEMADAADLLTVTANGSAQTLVDLGEALKMAGPHAKNAGADLKETCAALGILANMGIRGSLAGTALGKSYKRLADPKVQDYLIQFGIRTVDATGNLRSMRDILVEIGKTMRTMPSAQRITFAENIFDARGSLGSGILSQNIAGYDEFLKKLDNASGEAARIAKEMESGIGGSFRSMMSAAEGVGIAIGTAMNGPLSDLMNISTKFLRSVSEIIQNNKNLIASFAAVVGGGMAFGGVVKIYSMLAPSVAALFSPLTKLFFLLDALAISGKKAGMAVAFTRTQGKVIELIKKYGLLAATGKTVGKTILATNLSIVAAQMKAAAGGKGLTAVFYTKALVAKAAAGAMGILRSAMSAVAAHPITAGLIALGAVMFGVAKIAEGMQNKIQRALDSFDNFSQKTEKYQRERDKQRQKNQDAMNRLKELETISKKYKLTATQIKEAESLINQLDPFGNMNIGKIDKDFGLLHLSATAEADIRSADTKTARIDLLKDLEAKTYAWKQAKKNLESIQKHGRMDPSLWRGKKQKDYIFGWDVWNINERFQKVMNNRLEKERNTYQKMLEVQKRLKALEAGDQKAVYGQEGKEKTPAPRDLIQLASQKEIDKAEKALSTARQKLAKEDQDHFDREIENIRKENAEYKKQAQFLLENEKKKLELAERRLKIYDNAETRDAVNNSRKRIEDYKQQIFDIETSSDKAIEKVRAKRDRANAADDIELEFSRMERIRKNGPVRNYLNQYPAHLVNLQSLMQPLIADIEELAEEYRARWTKAWEKGEFDVDEQARLKTIRIEIEKRQGQIETYRERAKQGYEAMNNYRTTTVDSAASAIRKGSVEAAQLESRMQIVNPVRQDIEKVRKAINSLGKTGKDFYHDYRENSRTAPKYTAV